MNYFDIAGILVGQCNFCMIHLGGSVVTVLRKTTGQTFTPHAAEIMTRGGLRGEPRGSHITCP